jgi:hypothetical protein
MWGATHVERNGKVREKGDLAFRSDHSLSEYAWNHEPVEFWNGRTTHMA